MEGEGEFEGRPLWHEAELEVEEVVPEERREEEEEDEEEGPEERGVRRPPLLKGPPGRQKGPSLRSSEDAPR